MSIKEEFFKKDKMYGTTLVGTRGQVVIPSGARKDLKIKPGDRLIVVGKMGKALGLIKADQLADFIKTLMANIDDFDDSRIAIKKHLQKHASKILKQAANAK